MQIIIAGGGPAAVEGALAIRQHDQNSTIDLYTEENVLPYRRTLLPEVLAGSMPFERLLIYPEEFYRQKQINIHLSEKVVKVDKSSQTVTLQDNTVLKFDRLLLATGKQSRKLPAPPEVAGKIFSIHNHSDLKAVEKQITPEAEVVIVGGGILGLEITSALLKRKLKVHIVEQHNTILHGILDTESAMFLQKKLLEDRNLTLHTACSIQDFINQNGVKCRLNDLAGTVIYADFIISAIGLENAGSLGLELEVNNLMQVKDCRNIYAAGDCASIGGNPNRYYKSACMQGRIAGANIAGKFAEYTPLPDECRSKINDLPLYIAGKTNQENLLSNCQKDDKSLKKLFYYQDKLVGCILLGNTQDAGEVYSIIRKNLTS